MPKDMLSVLLKMSASDLLPVLKVFFAYPPILIEYSFQSLLIMRHSSLVALKGLYCSFLLGREQQHHLEFSQLQRVTSQWNVNKQVTKCSLQFHRAQGDILKKTPPNSPTVYLVYNNIKLTKVTKLAFGVSLWTALA